MTLYFDCASLSRAQKIVQAGFYKGISVTVTDTPPVVRRQVVVRHAPSHFEVTIYPLAMMRAVRKVGVSMDGF